MSTREQRDGRTIESQAQALRREVERRGAALVAHFEDDGVSGAKLQRPGLDRLRDLASRGGVDAVLIYSVDRLSRDATNLAIVKRDLERRGVRLMFLNIPDVEGSEGDLIVGVLGQFAEFERQLIRDRARRGRRYKVEERGLVAGTEAPYGYRYVKQDKSRGIAGRYEVDPVEARAVKRIFEWTLMERLSTVKIAKRLASQGVRTRRGKAWRHSTVAKILKDETYTGTTYYNKASVREVETRGGWVRRRRQNPRKEWIPIKLDDGLRLISMETFRRAREIVESKRTYPERRKYFYLLRNIKKTCAKCGLALTAVSSHGVRRYYVCSTVRRGGTCQYKTIRAERAEQPIWELFVHLVQSPEYLAELAAAAEAGQSDGDDSTSGPAAGESTARELAKARREEARLIAAYRRGVLELDRFELEYQAVRQRVKELEDMQRRQAAPRRDPSHATKDARAWAKLHRSLLASMSDRERECVVAEMFESIVFDGDTMHVAGCIPDRRLASTQSRAHGGEAASRAMAEFRVPIKLLHAGARLGAA